MKFLQLVTCILRCLRQCFCGRRKTSIILSIEFNGITIKGAMMYQFPVGTDSKTATVVFADEDGNTAPVDGIPAWALTGDNIGTVTAAPDGMSATIVFNNTVGQAQLSITADADLDAGEVRELIGTTDIKIVPKEAVVATISLA